MKLNILLIAGSLVFSGGIYAQTPDGDTPANEGVCDALLNATPGLYGLCIAYCEAQDLGDIDFSDDDAVQKAMPNQRILENYNRRKGAYDPEMPCLISRPVCPCFTISEIMSIEQPIQAESFCYQEPADRFGEAQAEIQHGDPDHKAHIHLFYHAATCLYVDARPGKRILRVENTQELGSVTALWDCFDIMYEACSERGDCTMGSTAECPNYPIP